MPVTFVHGVSTRGGNNYEQQVAIRDSFFRQFAFPLVSSKPKSVLLLNPYWGEFGARLRWNNACLPTDSYETLGTQPPESGHLVAEIAAGAPVEKDRIFLAVARRSLLEAIDMLWVATMSGSQPADRSGLVALAAKAVAYAKTNPHPTWIKSVQDDHTFIKELRKEVEAFHTHTPSPSTPAVETLGSNLWELVKEKADRVFGLPTKTLSSVVLDLGRLSLQKAASNFVGDVFVYLQDRGTRQEPGPIVERVLSALLQARNDANAKGTKFVVIGHSMGGNILYDILTTFRPDLKVDLFITCGSQVALFEELKLFVNSDPNIPSDQRTDRVSRPSNIIDWINIFDTNDIFGYRLEGVFSGVKDYGYDTGKGLFGAHVSYFLRPSFHDRLGERLKEALNDANAL